LLTYQELIAPKQYSGGWKFFRGRETAHLQMYVNIQSGVPFDETPKIEWFIKVLEVAKKIIVNHLSSLK
jgi:hypothetical protein